MDEGPVTSILALIDLAVEDYAQTVFGDIGGEIALTLQLAGIVSLAFLALNMVTQWMPIRMMDFMKWGVRYVVVLSVATTWAQFEPIYDMITNVPGSIGASLITVTNAPDLNGALDDMIARIFDYSDQANEDAGWFSIGLAAIVLWILGAIMAAVAVIVSAVAKVGLAFAVAVAPVFIGTLLFRGTSDSFNTWARFTLGFAMIPMVLAGVMGATIGVAEFILADTPADAGTLGALSSFLIICLVAIYLMAQVPTLVNGLAGTIVATASPAQVARDMQATARSTSRLALLATREGGYRLSQQESAVGAAAQAHAAGGGAREMFSAYRADFTQHHNAGKANRDAFTEKAVGAGYYPTGSQQHSAYRAGARLSRENAVAERRDGAPTSPRAGGPPPTTGSGSSGSIRKNPNGLNVNMEAFWRQRNALLAKRAAEKEAAEKANGGTDSSDDGTRGS